MNETAAYRDLVAHYARIHRYDHLAAMLSWDRSAMMPPQGMEARAAAEAELHTLIHGLRTDARLAGWIDAAGRESLDAFAAASLREIRRDWVAANAVPASLVEARTLAEARCEHAWRSQRAANDWEGFLLLFRDVVRLAREEARHLADATGLDPYDALLERYEPGARAADLQRLFDSLRAWLPGLVERIRVRQGTEAVIRPAGPFPRERQRALGRDVMERLGFNFAAGRLDESAHPFSGGVPEDVRLTTRYREDDFLQSLMGIIHETGHARYEQNLPRDWLGLPIGRARSFGIHESQSLALEMQLARSPAFAEFLSPLLDAHFGAQPAFEPGNLFRLLTRVAPGKIRVDADEATYPAHIILRFDIERALIAGDVEADAIPALWDAHMRELLGVDTRGDHRDGCLQDVHWPSGAFGYFPSYTLGALYAAQWFACIRRAHPDLDARIGAGDLTPVFAWLDANVWSQASALETTELTRRATGEPLDPAYFRQHLEARYLEGASVHRSAET
jgi:carboxypeptidase Taq